MEVYTSVLSNTISGRMVHLFYKSTKLVAQTKSIEQTNW